MIISIKIIDGAGRLCYNGKTKDWQKQKAMSKER